jgi:cytochrome c-type biogenesis protein CcmI
MITFWIIAATMLIAAILCAVVPLMQRESSADAPKARALTVSLYRRELADADADLHTGALSEDQHATLRSDIERRVLMDTAAAPSLTRRSEPRPVTRAATCALVIALFPTAACVLYLKLGEPAALQLDDSLGSSHGMSSSSVQMMVSRLAFRLRDHPPDPRDATDWATLVRSARSADGRGRGLCEGGRARAARCAVAGRLRRCHRQRKRRPSRWAGIGGNRGGARDRFSGSQSACVGGIGSVRGGALCGRDWLLASVAGDALSGFTDCGPGA